MYQKFLILILITVLFISCSKNEPEVITPGSEEESFEIYKEAVQAMNDGDILYASRKFSEAEAILPQIEFSAKASLMSSYCLYLINFYDEALAGLERFIKNYPADKNIIYAHYLETLIYFEQIEDEKKDLEPILKTKDKIDFFLKEFPDNDYAIDLKFKKELIINQIAAKELYVAKYYISVKKWIPAINRLKIIVDDYNQTIFIEEALHRLVEIHYHIGLVEEAKKYAKILGYNYNSSEWYEEAYKILNKDYKKFKKTDIKKDNNLFKKIIEKIK